MKKKTLVKLLAFALAATFALTGCGSINNAGSSTKESAATTDATASSTTVAASTTSASGDQSWSKVKDKGELILGLDESFPPMGYRDDNNEIIGYDIDLAIEVAKRLGVKLKLQPINWETKEQELNTGNIDCIWNGFTITKDRKVNVLFSDPYMKNQQVIVVSKDSKINTLADLKGKSVSLQATSSAADAVNANQDFKASLKELIELPDNAKCILDLQSGNTDAVAMDEIVARYFIQVLGKELRVLDEGLSAEEYGIGFRKTDVELMKKVNDTLIEMAKDGTVAKISEKWFGKDISIISK